MGQPAVLRMLGEVTRPVGATGEGISGVAHAAACCQTLPACHVSDPPQAINLLQPAAQGLMPNQEWHNSRMCLVSFLPCRVAPTVYAEEVAALLREAEGHAMRLTGAWLLLRRRRCRRRRLLECLAAPCVANVLCELGGRRS